jgi:uncharacterized protein YcgL (UPF0745 family)
MTPFCNILCSPDSFVSGGAINTPPEFVMYWRDELHLVDGDHCAALILNLLREWQGDHVWVEATLDEIRDAIQGMFGKTRIAAALKLLREKELVLARHNPDFGQVRTLQYHVTVAKPSENGGAE